MLEPSSPLRRRMRRTAGRVLRWAGLGRLVRSSPPIAALGVIGDRSTAAVVTRSGDVVWFCPGRFDAASLFGALLDPDVGGAWRIELDEARPAGRRYLGHSGVLQTTLGHPAGTLSVTDWMPLGEAGGPPGAVCRRLSAAPAGFAMVLTPRPDHGRRTPNLCADGPAAVIIDGRHRL